MSWGTVEPFSSQGRGLELAYCHQCEQLYVGGAHAVPKGFPLLLILLCFVRMSHVVESSQCVKFSEPSSGFLLRGVSPYVAD